MIGANPSFQPHLFPNQAVELFEQAYAVPGVSQVFEKMHQSSNEHLRTTANHMAVVGMIAAAEVVACSGQLECFDDRFSVQVVVGALLHDIGKGHPDITPLLAVGGKFTDYQRAGMRLHTRYGAEYLSRYAAIRGDDSLVPDMVYLHHADANGVKRYIAERGFSDAYARKLRAGVTLISISDVVESTLPIGDENSHSNFGNRKLPLGVVENEILMPLLATLPSVSFKRDALEAAMVYAEKRVAVYHHKQVSTTTNRQ